MPNPLDIPRFRGPRGPRGCSAMPRIPRVAAGDSPQSTLGRLHHPELGRVHVLYRRIDLGVDDAAAITGGWADRRPG